jgi:DNA-directed RNA polymerase specialized sigma24 family protein
MGSASRVVRDGTLLLSRVVAMVPVTDDFEVFWLGCEPRLRRAFAAAYGATRGADATAEALAWAWEHWDRVQTMANPAGYLYRVGQSRTRRRRRPPLFPAPEHVGVPWVEPALPAALAGLTEQQRVAVVLAHGFGWTHREVAQLLGISASTVQNHVERGLAKLRLALEVGGDD